MHSRSESSPWAVGGAVVLVALVSGAVAGCSGAPPGGPGDDAGAGMDSAAPPPPPPADASTAPPPVCQGVPPICATLDDATCVQVMGCAVSRCGGTAVACVAFASEAQCAGAAGCTWSGSSCTGTATGCEVLATDAECAAQMGCVWYPTASCHGAATPCARLDRAACSMQAGCVEILPDSGPPPPIDSGPPPLPIDSGPIDAGPSLWDGGGTCSVPAGPSPFPGCNPTDGIECDGDWRGINARTGAEYCTPACAAAECCSPQSGTFQCVPRAADGSCPAADLFVDASRIVGNYDIVTRTFASTDCEWVERCIGAPGTRRLLRFDTWTPNTGTADMFLGVPSATSTSFQYSPCHMHYHFDTYAEYELLTSDGACVAATGHKQAFCLLDFYEYPGTSSAGGVYNCGYQGIQRGWQDVYSRTLDCQWVDITDVPPGPYQLRIRINTQHLLYETDYGNNEIVVPVVIPP